MKKMFFVLAVFLLLVSCNGNIVVDPGTEPKPDPDPVVPTAGIDLINRGDFEDMNLANLGGQFSWGANEYIQVVEDNGNKVAKFSPNETTPAESFFRVNYQFAETSGTYSARIKLSNAADAEKVQLVVEPKNVQDQPIEGAVLFSKPEESTDWQEVKIVVPSMETVPYFTLFKVEVANGAGEVLVDDVSFIPEDGSKVNYMAYGDFEGNLEEKWKLITDGTWNNIPETDATDNYVVLKPNDELISDQSWMAGGSSDENYPKDKTDYPNVKDGELSLEASGNGKIKLRVEIKRPINDKTNEEAINWEAEFEVNGEKQICTLDVPKTEVEYTETIVHVIGASENSENIKIDNIKLCNK